MTKSIWVLTSLLCAPLPLNAEIFKCVGKNGADLYQNFPCHLDSIGSLPSSASPVPAPFAKAAGSADAKPAATAASVTQAGSAREPKVGMTTTEVKSIWGEPTETFEDELRDGRVDVWRYGGTRTVKFNRKGRVLEVQR